MAHMTINGREWTFEITETAVVVRDQDGKQTSTPRKKFHCFSTVTTRDVKRFIMNGLKPVDYTNDHSRIHWQKIEDGEIFVDDSGKPLDPADDLYPEHAKLEAVKEQSQAIGDFLDWLTGDRPSPIFLCERREGDAIDNIWIPCASVERLLAEYFDIDEKKLEAEKREILEKQRKSNKKVGKGKPGKGKANRA